MDNNNMEGEAVMKKSDILFSISAFCYLKQKSVLEFVVQTDTVKFWGALTKGSPIW